MYIEYIYRSCGARALFFWGNKGQVLSESPFAGLVLVEIPRRGFPSHMKL